jgi:AcrR family transcriptional regulator
MESRGNVSGSGRPKPVVRDRRIDRTRGAVIAAFNALLFERGYGRVSVRDVIERANVGRSTFYEHFQNKHDVLEQAMAPVLTPLADAVAARRDDAGVRLVVEHIWDGRELTGAILTGSARPLVTRLLARLVEERLERGRGVSPVPRALVSAALAGAQIALLDAWLSGAANAPPDAVADALVAMTAGAAQSVQSAR